jgi:NAD(P)-dependent dehydrogenase (short-subunit alcohol dehydrogenase family)
VADLTPPALAWRWPPRWRRREQTVIVNGRTHERVDKALRTSGAAHGIAADLGSEAGARAVIARFPAVDILADNLGIFEPKPFGQIPDDDWRRLFEVNVLSGARLSRHYVGPDRGCQMCQLCPANLGCTLIHSYEP